MNERARGALLGLAVGDALGTTYEFARIDQPRYPQLASGPATDVVGGGPFGLAAGQVTDDTQMAVCLARSLAARGELDVDDVGRRYVAWTAEAFDIGYQTRSSLDRLEAGSRASRAGLEVWRAAERRPAGNGSLMRTVPIGVAYARRGDDARTIAAAIADSLITHADPRCALACAAFDVAVAHAIAAPRSGQALVAIAAGVLPQAANALRAALEREGAVDGADARAIETAHTELALDLELAAADDPQLYGGGVDLQRTAGFVRVAFRLAFWHAAHTTSWRDALVDVASRGGDADTNAAIVGALLGARDGELAIPRAWTERVLAARQPGSDAWADDHHPRHLLALAE